MGIDKTDYVMVGYKLNEEETKQINAIWTDESILPYIEGRPGYDCSLIFDMNGDNMVFGKVLIRFNSYNDETNFRGVDVTGIKYDMEDVQSTFNQVFAQLNINRKELPTIVAFSNFS